MNFILFTFTFITIVYFVAALSIIKDDSKRHRFPRETGNSDPTKIVRDFLREARSESGEVDLNALLTENVVDPTTLSSFNISSDGFITKVFGMFTELQLYGLKDFRVKKVSMSLAQMNLSAEMFLPVLSIVGHYYLDGTVTFFPISGEGPFWMNMTSIILTGHSLIETTPAGKLAMGDIQLNSVVEDISLHFENLMGGGAWGSISNSLLNQLSEMILGELKPTLLSELSSYLKHQFDDVLFEQLPDGFMGPGSTNLVDNILERTSAFMVERKMEPMSLPNLKEVYERQILFMTTRGEIGMYNGTLHGLSTINRRGDVVTVFENNSFELEADFGFDNLTGNYSWFADVMGVRTSGTMDIQVKDVEGFVRLKQQLKSGSRLELDTLYVKDIRHVWLDLQGLGTWDYLMESVVNLVTNGLKLQLADAITQPVKESIQEQLDALNIGIP
ncbi:uncharacterized protein LOC129227726 [Uloborus diversus]|uniref:uncharacterized protein LOC129227726 n=1 Tax=Uloborus diversus TaxID=327109 RepID=UPI00240931FF|nr:uncharacterized protein LOC129227726 [Uloborus diversus]